jgi:hypothetical protein
MQYPHTNQIVLLCKGADSSILNNLEHRNNGKWLRDAKDLFPGSVMLSLFNWARFLGEIKHVLKHSLS